MSDKINLLQGDKKPPEQEEQMRVHPELIPPKSLNERHLADYSVTNSALADGSVTNVKIGADAVTSDEIQDASVTFSKLATALVVLSTETIASNDNDTTVPTSAAVKDYADSIATGTITRSFFIPATAMITTVGSPSLTDTDDTTPYWSLDAAADEGVGTTLYVPADYDSGNITLYIHWASLTTNTGNIRWSIRRSGFTTEDENVLSATTNTNFTEAAIATTNDLNISAGQAISGAAARDVMSISVRRLGTDAADTLTGDVGFLGLEVTYTSAQ